jgi:PAS domain S-box-containing protein
MKWSRKLSLRRKITFVIMINTFAALCAAGVAFAKYGVNRFQQVEMRDLETLAQILGTSSTAALSFKDPNSANDILQALAVKPHIIVAVIYDRDDKPFAAYQRSGSHVPDIPQLVTGETSRFTADRIRILQTIKFDGEKIGTVFLEGDKDEDKQLLNSYLAFFALIVAAVSLGAYVMAVRLQRVVSNPILQLAWTTKMVTSSRDFTIRAAKQSEDEVGVLIDGFNGMLEQIQKRDTELRHAREDLERRVDERTMELAQEVLDRERAQEALHESKERIRLLLDSTAEAIFGINRDGKCTFCNPATLRLLGYESVDALLGKFMFEVTRHSRGDGSRYPLEVCPIVEARLSGKEIHSDSDTFWRSDNTNFPVEYWAYPIRKDGEVVGVVVTFVDITERKRAQAALLEAKEVAEAASRAKSEFLANMSHEIRTPMNGIIGMTDLALDTPLTTEQRDYLSLVKSSADSLLRVIDDILDFSKIEAGKLELEQTEFKIRDMLKDTLKTLAVRADAKGTELSVRVSPDVPVTVVGDPTRLRQLVVNLVGNSIKFTDKGTIVLDAELESSTGEDVRLHMSVSDSGIGIPLEKQELIFEPFAQADGSTTRRFGGTGLGLAISRQLVELMDGRMWLESELGKGSRFHFACAFKRGAETAPDQELAAGRIPPGLEVLIVDNNPANCRIFAEMLTNWGIKPTAMENGGAGLAALEDARTAGHPFPIALLDARMPGIDGFQIMEKVRANPSLAGAVIMMLPTDRHMTDARRCRELGVKQILTKPVGQSELFDAIVSALGAGSARQASVQPSTPIREEPAGRSLRILLCEDNSVNQKLAMRLLEKAGHRVTLASTGREGLAAWENASRPGFDVVLMDIQMPDMDGLEATTEIRKREWKSGRHIPIIAMTAHAMRGDKERYLAGGMDGYISKPIRRDGLFAEIERCLAATQRSLTMSENGTRAGEIIDRASLLERVEGDHELLAEMINLFVEDAPNLLASMRDALKKSDMLFLERSAHSLKGAASNLSAQTAAAAAQKLERDAKQANAESAKASLLAVEKEVDRLLPALTDICQGVSK